MFEIIRSLASGEGFGLQNLVHIFVLVFIVVCCNPVHESAHAWAADKLGDPTGRLKGRITMNPLRHLDLIGALMLLLFGFGYAKAVPVNMRNFPAKKRKFYFALTAAAGPVSNLILALFFALLQMGLLTVAYKAAAPSLPMDLTLYQFCLVVLNSSELGEMFISNSLLLIGIYFFFYAATINIMLAVFNLIPFPPLDGSRLVTAVLPDRIYYKIMGYERYTMIALFALLFLLSRLNLSPMSWATGKVLTLLLKGLCSLFSHFL